MKQYIYKQKCGHVTTKSIDKLLFALYNQKHVKGEGILCNFAGREEVSSFLEKAKELISRGSFVFVSRRKNLQSLAEFGLTIIDAKEEILDLRIKDYYKGPKKDFDRPGFIWEFKKVIRKKKFYIKLKISAENGKEVLKCLGFHKDDFDKSLRGDNQ